MPALFDEGFFVRKPAWHQLGIVLQEYPGREEAMRLAGHDFIVIERRTYTDTDDGGQVNIPGYKALIKEQQRAPEDTDDTNGSVIGIVRESFKSVQNNVPWDIIDWMVNQDNVRYETGATLDGGAQCFVTAWVDEPLEIRGDDSPIYPYYACNWRHDGLGAIKLIKTSVREVCANTVTLAESEAERTGFEYTFRHTKNVMGRIEEARAAMKGLGDTQQAFAALANELGEYKITPRMRLAFVTEFIPAPPGDVVSDRVMANIEEARAVVTALLDSSRTIPDAHRDTGYGLLMAGTEYLDHLRGYRNSNTYVGRTLLRREPLKEKLVPLIREVVAA